MDHHFALLLVWKIRQGMKRNIEPERISAYVISFFESEIVDHFSSEEKDLFSKLSFDDPFRKRALLEHETIYGLVNRIKMDSHNTIVLCEFADSLEGHIRFEERILFNHLQSVLPDKEFTRLLDEQSQGKCEFDKSWKDQFWVK
jgi:hypothetical protein